MLATLGWLETDWPRAEQNPAYRLSAKSAIRRIFFHPTNIVQFRDPLHDGKRTHGGKLTAMYRRGLSSPLRRGAGISAPAKMIIFVGDKPAGWFIATG